MEDWETEEKDSKSGRIKLRIANPEGETLNEYFGADVEKLAWAETYVRELIEKEDRINSRIIAGKLIEKFELTPEEWLCIFYALGHLAGRMMMASKSINIKL